MGSLGIEKNILSFNIESKSEMMRIEKIARDKKKLVDVAIRFNPEIDAGGHEYIKTGRKKDKFGILVSETLKLAKYISNSEHLNLIGLSCHIGSQIFELDDFKAAANFTKKLAEEVNKMGVLTINLYIKRLPNLGKVRLFEFRLQHGVYLRCVNLPIRMVISTSVVFSLYLGFFF